MIWKQIKSTVISDEKTCRQAFQPGDIVLGAKCGIAKNVLVGK